MAEIRGQHLGTVHIAHGVLPRSLALPGLAPEIGNEVELAFWPVRPGQPNTATFGSRIDHGHIPEHAAAEAGITAAAVHKLPMRQLLLRIAGPFPHYVPGPIGRILDEAPDNINCYTDGGITNEAAGLAALPGWGGVLRSDDGHEEVDLLNNSAWTEIVGGELRF